MMMPISESRARANKKYQLEKTDEIKLRVPKGNKERIQEHAKSQGESTNAFIYRAVNETIERDQAKRLKVD
jgi:predicted HicB family RNase H-like nuclease